MADVKLTFLANGESAEAVIARLEKKLEGLTNQVKQTAQASRKSTSEATGLMSGWVGQLAGVAAGYVSIASAIDLVIAANKEWQATADKAAESQDEANRRLNVQLKLFGEKGAAASKLIASAGIAAAVSPAEAKQFAGALHEKGGLTAEQVPKLIGSILPGAEAIMAAKPGTTREQIADAVGDWIVKSGGKIEAGTAAAATEDIFAMTSGAELNVSDIDKLQQTMMEWSKPGKGLLRMRQQLGRLGLKPEEFAKGTGTVPAKLAKLEEGLNKIPENQRAGELAFLFGDSDMAQNAIEAMHGMAANRGQFQPAVAEITAGRKAGQVRVGALGKKFAAANADEWSTEDIQGARERVEEAIGMTPIQRKLSGMATGFTMAIPFGKDAVVDAIKNAPAGTENAAIREVLEESRRSNSRVEELLERIADGVKKKPERNRDE